MLATDAPTCGRLLGGHHHDPTLSGRRERAAQAGAHGRFGRVDPAVPDYVLRGEVGNFR